MTVNRSGLMTAYNVARGMVPDVPRLNRALGVAQRRQPRPYLTTATSCTCPDWRYRLWATGQPCKHMLGRALVIAASDN